MDMEKQAGRRVAERPPEKKRNGKKVALVAVLVVVLALGAGCCTQCGECTYPHAPCRFPEKMISSMEAFGILVLEVCQANGLPYYYGSDKIAYTSCFLLAEPAVP